MAHANPLESPLRRSTIGPYRVEEVLGVGGMGVVCRARGPDGRPLAVKMLLTLLLDPSAIHRFEQEARVRIEHPNVVRVLDAGTDVDGMPYIAFELLEGQTLEQRLLRGRLSIAEAVDLGRQVARGLAAAHDGGIVHRDLKPANLFVCSDGTIKILDFGIALTEHHTRLTREGIVLGTAAYLSPEQARGGHDIDARTDLWALGAVLYEAVSGRKAFERSSSLATMLAVLMDELPPLPADVPAPMARVIERALAKAPSARWATARALEAALDELDAMPSAATVPSSRPEPLVAVTPGESRVVALLLAEGVESIARLTNEIEGRGGRVVPVLGSRAIGVFGGETSTGDEAQRAAQSALAARSAAQRIAIATGRVTQRGAAVSGAALSSAEAGCGARLGGVAVDSATARALADAFSLRRASDELFELLSVGSPDSGVARAPTFGRAVELAQLEAAIKGFGDTGRTLAVVVSGPPGIGKTRLRREAERLLRDAIPDAAVLTGRGELHRRDAAFSTLATAVASFADAQGVDRLGPDTGVEARVAMARRLTGEVFGSLRDPAQIECARLLGELFGVPSSGEGLDGPGAPPGREGEPPLVRADPRLVADQLRVALHDWFEALHRSRPVVVFVEDAHFADPTSLDVLDELVCVESGMLVVVTARPELLERRQGLFSGCGRARIDLGGLPLSDVASLAAAAAGRPLPDDVVRAIHDRTAGNPLFVEEIAYAMADDPGPASGAALPLPHTVEAAVQSRLDLLPVAEKEACKRAAVLGRAFDADDLVAMGSEGDAAAVLVSLAQRDLVARRPSRSTAGPLYAFKSTLVADVAYRMLDDEVRLALHRRAAARLARGSDADAAEVALHHERGGDLAAAATAYVGAVTAAAGRGDAQTVLRCSQRALEIGISREARVRLHLARADAFRFLGQREPWGDELGAALAEATGEEERARALTERAVWLWRSGRLAEARTMAEDAVAASSRASGAANVLARTWQAAIELHAGNLEGAARALDQAEAHAGSEGAATRALLEEWRGQHAAASGHVGRQLAHMREAVRLYREAGDLRRAAGAECNLADGYNRIGAYREAEIALRAAREGCRRVANRVMEGYALLNLGYSLAGAGRADEAIAVLREASEMAVLVGDARLAVGARLYTGRALLAAGALASRPEHGDLDERMEALAAEAESHGMRGWAAAALALAARAAVELGRPERAESAAARAMAIRDELGGLEEDEADLFLAAAGALAAVGKADEAARIFEKGRARIAEILGTIVDDDSRASFAAVASNARLLGGR